MTRETKTEFLINTVFFLVVGVIIFFSVKFLFVYLLPFIIGTLVTVLVQRPAAYVSDKLKIRKGYCALVFVIVIYLTIVAAAFLLFFKMGIYVSEVAISDSGLVKQIGDTFDEIVSKLEAFSDKIPPMLSEQISGVIDSIVTSLTGYVSDFAKGIARATPMFLTTSIVTIIASCYIAKDFDRFVDSVGSVLSDRYKRAIRELRFLFKDNVIKLLAGYLKLLIITFLELAGGLLLLKIDNAFIIALIIALLDLLPVIGTGTVLIPWAIYSLITGTYFVGVGLLILYIIIMLIRNIIEPKIIGKQMGLHPLIALISVFIGLKLFGFIGIFIAPFTVMLIYKMYDRGIFDILLQK